MKAHTEHQIIAKNGVPLFVVVPYDEYIAVVQRAQKKEKKVYFPHEVVEKTAVEGKSVVRAWREYKRLSQKAVAAKMGITQAAYSQLEKSQDKMRASTIKKIAMALDVDENQMEM
jgi:prevent-host-death family protein